MIKKEIYQIKNISDKGYGEVFDGHEQMWVKNTIIGEIFELSPEKGRKFYCAEDIIDRSDKRIEPECVHFLECGGCQLQHLNKETYRSFKINVLRKHLDKSGYAIPDNFRFFDIDKHSRKKASFLVDYSSNPIKIGFQTEFSHHLVDIEQCLIVDEDIFKIMYIIKEELASFIRKYQINRLTIAKVSGKIDLMLHHEKIFDGDSSKTLTEFARNHQISRVSAYHRGSVNLIIELEPVEKIGEDYKIKLYPNSFMQSSLEMEEIIFENISKKIERGKNILDLYSGFGFLTMKFAEFAPVRAYELSQVMVKNLKEAAAKFPRKFPLIAEERDLNLNPLTAENLNKFDHIIANPPYKGFYNQVKEIAKSRCRRVSVVSCNPASFARDAYYLKQANYKLEEIMIIDQFLYSSHLELLALFVKS